MIYINVQDCFSVGQVTPARWNVQEEEKLLNKLRKYAPNLNLDNPFFDSNNIWKHIAQKLNKSVQECQEYYIGTYWWIPIPCLKQCLLDIRLHDQFGCRLMSFSIPNRFNKNNNADLIEQKLKEV